MANFRFRYCIYACLLFLCSFTHKNNEHKSPANHNYQRGNSFTLDSTFSGTGVTINIDTLTIDIDTPYAYLVFTATKFSEVFYIDSNATRSKRINNGTWFMKNDTIYLSYDKYPRVDTAYFREMTTREIHATFLSIRNRNYFQVK